MLKLYHELKRRNVFRTIGVYGATAIVITTTAASLFPFLYFPDSRRWDFPHIRFFNQQDFLGLMLSSGLKPVVNLCHHFPSFPKIGRLMPTTVKKRISKQFPDSFAEGFTYLFKKWESVFSFRITSRVDWIPSCCSCCKTGLKLTIWFCSVTPLIQDWSI